MMEDEEIKWPSASDQREWDRRVMKHGMQERSDVSTLPRISEKTAQKLKGMGIKTRGDLARTSANDPRIKGLRIPSIYRKGSDELEAYDSEEWWKTQFGQNFLAEMAEKARAIDAKRKARANKLKKGVKFDNLGREMKPFKYKGDPVDMDRFFRAYAADQKRTFGDLGGLRVAENEMIIKGDDGEPLIVQVGNDGRLRYVDMSGNVYDTFDTLDDLIDAYGMESFYDAYSGDDDGYISDVDDDWRDMYAKYRKRIIPL